MAVDKNLFLYDLAVVAIMKNEGPYIKEWLDYHLLAGVNHFYIYDNESPDNMKEVLQPYIERGLVTYTFYPGKCRQVEAYNEAVQKYRFFCRYMTFLDGDEFIFPQGNKSIVEVVDEILYDKPNAAALGVNWHCFGSNFQEKADYSRGVLERFTRRAPNDWRGGDYVPEKNNITGNAHIKTIANPRRIRLFVNPHFAFLFDNYFAINETGKIIPSWANYPVTDEKIAINHYNTKSREEYDQKIQRGNADSNARCTPQQFLAHDRNEIFDDSILKYRDARKSHGGVFDLEINYHRVCNALLMNLSSTFAKNIPLNFFAGKLETFLTCRALAAHLRENILDETAGNFFEEAALNAIYKTLHTQVAIPDLRLFFSELPNFLVLNYPVVENLREASINLIQQLIALQRTWKDRADLEYLMSILKTFENYTHK